MKSTFNRLISIWIIILSFLPQLLFSQGKQANNWYFGEKAGITFQNGSPPTALLDGQSNSPSGSGTACISDKDGNLLFYSDGVKIWNKNHQVMTNGDMMGTWSTQGAMIIQDPGNENRYYFFNFTGTGNPGAAYNFQYSIIDMTNGLGEVLPDKKNILLYTNTTWHLSAVLHDNMTNVWVLTHSMGSNRFKAFEVTPNGIITNPIESYAGSSFEFGQGYMKISSDGEWIGVGNHLQDLTEIYHFDNVNGIVSNQNVVTIPVGAYGIEFSPDNTKMYAQGGFYRFYQYDLSSGDPSQIAASAFQVANDYFNLGALQLAPDGKIYVGTSGRYLSVVHDPDKLGASCNFEYNAVYLEGRVYLEGLPTFLQSYMRNPEFVSNQKCSGLPTQFSIVNTNGIDSVQWNFHDPGNAPNDTSTLFSPSYTFSTADTFYVELIAHSGLLHRTVIDTVIIYQTPDPNLGRDTIFCANETINLTLDASPGEQFFWNSNFNPGQPPTYYVSDTGYYRVKVKNHGCSGNDTIHVGRYNEPELINPGQTNPAHCSTADGSITGVLIDAGSNPFNVIWKDALNNVVGNSADLLSVPSGVYNLEITYGVDCMVSFGPYSIQDIGGTQIASAVPEDDHCNLGLGEITVTPDTGNPGDYWYSINGSPFIQNGGVFNGLAEGSYTVMIKDQFGCIGSYPNNPVAVGNIPGPEFSNILVNPENSGNGLGSITVYGTGSNLTYSIDNNPFQSGNSFSNLSEGDYLIQIMDEFGCLEDSSVHVDNLIGTKLYAMADGDRKCLNVLANSNIRVSNVSGVKDFTATLSYDGTRLRCIHFNGSLEGIDGTVYPATSKILLEWHGDSPIPDNDTITLGDLIFETLQSGFADVNWQDPPETVFKDEYGNIIDPSSIQFFEGIIEVHELPDAILDSVPPICEGDEITLTPTISGGADPVTFEWSTPNGASSINNILIENAQPEHAGKYSFKVSDRYHCADTADIELTVTPLPRAYFPEVNDTIWYEGTFKLEAPDYYYSYEWSNGDTIWYINVTKEGLYSVQLKTEEGCQNLESVMMMDGLVPISVPNAFTPNGDGLNDTFSPIVDTELVRRFHLTIYNQWGQRIFESTNADKAWDGRDVMPGVYSWVISYENRNRKAFQLKGSVTLIR